MSLFNCERLFEIRCLVLGSGFARLQCGIDLVGAVEFPGVFRSWLSTCATGAGVCDSTVLREGIKYLFKPRVFRASITFYCRYPWVASLIITAIFQNYLILHYDWSSAQLFQLYILHDERRATLVPDILSSRSDVKSWYIDCVFVPV